MKKGIYLPLSEAFQISLDHIWKLRTRSMIMVVSTALGISYLTYFLASNAIFSASLKRLGVSVEAYQLWLVVLSIFVCGVGLVNSTLIAVLQRYREIGTMKCLGALDRHILELLLIEAFFFGLFGGVAGFILGVSVSMLSSGLQLGFNVINLPSIEFLGLLGQILVLSITLNITSTIYSALRAARLNPVEALRYDV